jgi:hypothetical protein
MKLDGIVRAHEFMHIERPPVLWEADTQDEMFIRLLGELIAFALQRSPDVSTLTLNVANIVVETERSGDWMPTGEYVAVTVRGPEGEACARSNIRSEQFVVCYQIHKDYIGG